MNDILDRVMKARQELRDEIQEAVDFIRRQGWVVHQSSDYNLEVAILNDDAMNFALDVDAIPDLSEAIYSRATMRLKQVTLPKRVPVNAGQIKQALRLCNWIQTKDFQVGFVPYREKEPDWPLPMWSRSELGKYVREHLGQLHRPKGRCL